MHIVEQYYCEVNKTSIQSLYSGDLYSTHQETTTLTLCSSYNTQFCHTMLLSLSLSVCVCVSLSVSLSLSALLYILFCLLYVFLRTDVLRFYYFFKKCVFNVFYSWGVGVNVFYIYVFV